VVSRSPSSLAKQGPPLALAPSQSDSLFRVPRKATLPFLELECHTGIGKGEAKEGAAYSYSL